jgi:hypothetical protein
MARRAKDREAAPGSVGPQLLRDLLLLRDYMVKRDESLTFLFGYPIRRNPLRLAIMRGAVISLGLERLQPISYYERTYGHIGSRSAIYGEVHALADAGLIILRPSATDGRLQVVAPSERLVSWHADQAESVRDAIFERTKIPEGNGQAPSGV